MKHFTLIGMAALLSVSVQAQVFTSGLETWNSGLPSDFMGSKTNIATSAVTQVTDNPHGGTYAVRLENTTATHKRFSTQPLAVEAGQEYTITFWARGAGEVRFGLFDNRLTSSGYSYSSYTTVTTTWQQYTMTRTAEVTYATGEFILSVVNTVAPEHMVIDDVTITSGATTITPIHDIQFTTAGDGASPMVEQIVTINGIVTAVFPTTLENDRGYFVQDATGPWNGIFVYDVNNVPAIGDEVTVTGEVVEHYGLTELSFVASHVVVSSGNPLPTPNVVTTSAAAAEQYESTLVKVLNANCVDPTAANGQWIVNDGSAELLVSRLIYDAFVDQDVHYDVTGPLYYTFSEWKIVPRNADDVATATSIGEFAGATVTLFPNPATTTLTLDLGTLSGRTEYTMTDVMGRTVLADVATGVRSTLDVSNLSNGTYVVTLRNAGSVWSTRVQVQH